MFASLDGITLGSSSRKSKNGFSTHASPGRPSKGITTKNMSNFCMTMALFSQVES